VLVNGAFMAFILDAYPYLPNAYMSCSMHRPVVFLVMAACVVTFAVACSAEPGVITKRNAAALDNYPADDVIFRSGAALCRTCAVPKLARSKHCRVCGRCISR
jgi:palmitoyltransferase ZDHHC4